MTTAALYARVSSEQQREEQTIGSQLAALKAHATEVGLKVPPDWIFADEGYSGASLVRPALEKLRDLATQVHVEVILCYSPDRLARKYAFQALLIDEFTRAGTAVRFVKGPKADTPEDELLLQFQGMIAEYERAQIVERSRRGKLHRARCGMVNVLSNAPYGYRYVRKSDHAEARYEIVEEQAEVVRAIFKRYTEDQVAIGVLARWLTAQGTRSATGRSRWERTAIWGMLRNPAYCGRAAFGKTMESDGQAKVVRSARLRKGGWAGHKIVRDRPRDQWIEIPVPAIVSEDVFELASRRLQENRRFAARRTKEPTLLQGLLVCESCGYAYYRTAAVRTTARKIYYYRCIGSDNFRFETGRVCQSQPIRQDYLDEVVWKHATQLLSDPTIIRRELDRRLEELRSTSPVTREKSRLERELAKATASVGRLLQGYQEGLLTIEELRTRMPDVRRREATLREQLTALEGQRIDQERCLKLAENLDSFRARLRDAAATSTIQDRQRIVRLVIREVLVGAERVTIRHCIPTPRPPAGSEPMPAFLLCGRRDLSADEQRLSQ
jgi:site-specific DNA recombinase